MLAHLLITPEARRAAARCIGAQDPDALLQAIGPLVNRQPTLDTLAVDVPLKGSLRFEHLAGLFGGSQLEHGVISLPIRQAAYLWGMTRAMQAKTAIEIGRYKGGSTLLLAASLGPGGHVWSIDLGDKEARLGHGRAYDTQLQDALGRWPGLVADIDLIVGDSRTVEVETGEVDVVFIDGDHSYEGTLSDLARWGARVRVGGSVFCDDAFDEPLFPGHTDTVGRAVEEACRGQFRLVGRVLRLAHLQRIH